MQQVHQTHVHWLCNNNMKTRQGLKVAHCVGVFWASASVCKVHLHREIRSKWLKHRVWNDGRFPYPTNGSDRFYFLVIWRWDKIIKKDISKWCEVSGLSHWSWDSDNITVISYQPGNSMIFDWAWVQPSQTLWQIGCRHDLQLRGKLQSAYKQFKKSPRGKRQNDLPHQILSCHDPRRSLAAWHCTLMMRRALAARTAAARVNHPGSREVFVRFCAHRRTNQPSVWWRRSIKLRGIYAWTGLKERHTEDRGRIW